MAENTFARGMTREEETIHKGVFAFVPFQMRYTVRICPHDQG